MKHYVEGREELAGKVNYSSIGDEGKISIGVRQNLKSLFRGSIRMIKFTNLPDDSQVIH